MMTPEKAISVPELRVLGEVLQLIGDVRGEQSTFAAIASKVSEHLLGGSELFIPPPTHQAPRPTDQNRYC